MRPFRHAFTLIELLVVVTIIVVLLALLTPALDKAIYQAELAACAAGQNGIAAGAIQYAMSSKQYYPPRAATTDWQPSQLIGPAGRVGTGTGAATLGYDLRPLMRQVVSLKALNDPLAGRVDYESATPDSYTYSPYNLWFGWFFLGSNTMPQGGMRKMGQRLTWIEPADTSGATVYKLDTLVSDHDYNYPGAGDHWAAHPDATGQMVNDVRQDQEMNAVEKGVWGSPNGRYTYAYWITRPLAIRGPIDSNVGFQDGSVRRYNAVTDQDPQMVRVPYRNDAWPTHLLWINLPPR